MGRKNQENRRYDQDRYHYSGLSPFEEMILGRSQNNGRRIKGIIRNIADSIAEYIDYQMEENTWKLLAERQRRRILHRRNALYYRTPQDKREFYSNAPHQRSARADRAQSHGRNKSSRKLGEEDSPPSSTRRRHYEPSTERNEWPRPNQRGPRDEVASKQITEESNSQQ